MKENSQVSKNKYRWDIIFISALLIFSAITLLIVYTTKEEGAKVTVEIDGVFTAEYPLDTDGFFSLNNGTNVLVIEKGEAYLNYSSCPDHTCENTGKIRYVGQTIICLPNRVSITVTGDGDGGVDLVS